MKPEDKKRLANERAAYRNKKSQGKSQYKQIEELKMIRF